MREKKIEGLMNSHFPFCLCPARPLLSPRATRALHARPIPKRNTPPLPAAAAAGAFLAPGTLGPLFGFRPPTSALARARASSPPPSSHHGRRASSPSQRACSQRTHPVAHIHARRPRPRLPGAGSVLGPGRTRAGPPGRHDPFVLVKDCRARFGAPPLACKALAAAAAGP